MPGANCAIYGCGACRSVKYKGISIIKVPFASDEASKNWRSEILNIITKDRVVDATLRKRIEEDKVFICEQHFAKDDFYNCKYEHEYLCRAFFIK